MRGGRRREGEEEGRGGRKRRGEKKRRKGMARARRKREGVMGGTRRI